MALTALRPFVRLSRRLERQVLVPAQPDSPEPVDAPKPAVPRTVAEPTAVAEPPSRPVGPDQPSEPVAEPPVPPSTEMVTNDGDTSAATTEQFQAVDASVVPVPLESLNRLVLAVDELGSEMTQVRQAIRELTTTLSASQASFARIVAGQVTPATPESADPLAAVTGPYVAGSSSPTPFDAQSAADAEDPGSPPELDPTTLAPPVVVPEPPPTPVSPPPFSFADPPTAPMPTVAAAEHSNGLGDLPIVHTGEVPVVIGPVRSLDELDDAVSHIQRINGVENVSVTSFEGSQVVLTTELSRALPLASLLRTDLGRDVASCRLVDGRIVVDFGEAGRRA